MPNEQEMESLEQEDLVKGLRKYFGDDELYPATAKPFWSNQALDIMKKKVEHIGMFLCNLL